MKFLVAHFALCKINVRPVQERFPILMTSKQFKASSAASLSPQPPNLEDTTSSTSRNQLCQHRHRPRLRRQLPGCRTTHLPIRGHLLARHGYHRQPSRPNVLMITADYTESTLTSSRPKYFQYGRFFPFPYTASSLPEICNIMAAGFD